MRDGSFKTVLVLAAAYGILAFLLIANQPTLGGAAVAHAAETTAPLSAWLGKLALRLTPVE